jgi:hypothetical protein
MVDGVPVHVCASLDYLFPLRKSLFGTICRFRFLLNHVNAILNRISWWSPPVAVHKKLGAAFFGSEFKSLSDLPQQRALWPGLD